MAPPWYWLPDYVQCLICLDPQPRLGAIRRHMRVAHELVEPFVDAGDEIRQC